MPASDSSLCQTTGQRQLNHNLLLVSPVTVLVEKHNIHICIETELDETEQREANIKPDCLLMETDQEPPKISGNQQG